MALLTALIFCAGGWTGSTGTARAESRSTVRPGPGTYVRGRLDRADSASQNPTASSQTSQSAGGDPAASASGGAPTGPVLTKKETFEVEVLTPSLQGNIGMCPGTYPVEEPLRLRITSSHAGWQTAVKSTDLKNHKRSIRAGEVHLLKDDGTTLPLHKFRKVVTHGPSGTTLLEIRLVLKTTSCHRAGRYCGWIYISSRKPSGAKSPLIKVPFCVTVELRASHSYSGNRMYFHFGHAGEPLNGVVEGSVEADAPMHLVLSVQEGNIGAMPLLRKFGDTPPPPGTSIPLAWALREAGSADYDPPDCRSSDGKKISWRLRGTPGETDYRLRLTVAPDAYQPPGDYGMRVEVGLVPDL